MSSVLAVLVAPDCGPAPAFALPAAAPGWPPAFEEPAPLGLGALELVAPALAPLGGIALLPGNAPLSAEEPEVGSGVAVGPPCAFVAAPRAEVLGVGAVLPAVLASLGA
jgi:hypothetical protein